MHRVRGQRGGPAGGGHGVAGRSFPQSYGAGGMNGPQGYGLNGGYGNVGPGPGLGMGPYSNVANIGHPYGASSVGMNGGMAGAAC